MQLWQINKEMKTRNQEILEIFNLKYELIF